MQVQTENNNRKNIFENSLKLEFPLMLFYIGINNTEGAVIASYDSNDAEDIFLDFFKRDVIVVKRIGDAANNIIAGTILISSMNYHKI